jgi:hypothetical protein
LISKIESNINLLELISAEIFRKVSNQLHATPIDMNVDPYSMKIDDDKTELLTRSETKNSFPVDDLIRTDIDKMWLKKIKNPENEFVQ